MEKNIKLITILITYATLFIACGKVESTRSKVKPVKPLLELSRDQLLHSKKDALKLAIAPILRKNVKPTFTRALEHYEKLLKKPENIKFIHEKIRMFGDGSSISKPVSDIKVSLLHNVDVVTTPDWMHLHDRAVADAWSAKNAAVTYMDFANASLGGGAFGHGWVQEEQMVGFCTEFALLLAGEPYKSTDDDLNDPANINFITRNTRSPSKVSPKPKYLTNIRCSTGTPPGVGWWDDIDLLEHNDHPPAVNILAVAAVDVSQKGNVRYELLDVVDLFSNLYRGFELVKKTNAGKKNVIFGGRIGAGVFGQSVLMSAAMQILAAKIVGIEYLVLTGNQGSPASGNVSNIYQEALDNVNDFIAAMGKKIIGMKIEDILAEFLERVKDDPKWEIKSTYK